MLKKPSHFSPPANRYMFVHIRPERGYGDGLWKVVGERMTSSLEYLLEAVDTNDHFIKGERVSLYAAHTVIDLRHEFAARRAAATKILNKHLN